MILVYLPTKDLKQTRLVCRSFASIGARLLIGTLHISPREKDMIVFDAVTQHPLYSKSVKHLFLDSAQFSPCSLRNYFDALGEQFMSDRYQRVRESNTAVQQLIVSIKRTAGYDGEPHGEVSKARFEQCCHFPQIVDGYQTYSQLSNEQKNFSSRSWIVRVFRGLSVLGPIQSMTVGNTFELRMQPEPTHESRTSDREHGYTVATSCNRESYDGYDGDHDNLTGHASYIQLSTADIVSGKRSVGSPSARGWPFTSLQPTSTGLGRHKRSATEQDPTGNGKSNGSSEFMQAIQLLCLSEKQPSFFSVMCNQDPKSGLPPQFFYKELWPRCMPSLGWFSQLKILRLKFGCQEPMKKEEQVPHLHHLRQLFHGQSPLEQLTLHFPVRRDGSGMTLYQFSQIFPSVMEWHLHKLRSLHLLGLSVPYGDLISLLFINLASLSDLQLGFIQITNGQWEGIIEGFRQFREPLERCCFKGELYDTNGRFRNPKYGHDTPRFMADISHYIVNGGRHPSLPDTYGDDGSCGYTVPTRKALRELVDLYEQRYEKVDSRNR
ncbi:MAG: hypothetical protein Q9170_003311 [Blastenia crenularia]